MNQPDPSPSAPDSDPMQAFKVKPIQRAGVSHTPAGQQRWDGRDLFAEAQVRGLALVVFAVAGLQGLATLGLMLVAAAAGSRSVDPGMQSQLALLAPPALLLLVLVVKIIESRAYKFMVLVPTVFFMSAAVWGYAAIAQRATLSMAACALLTGYLAQGLWRFGGVARLLAAGWALLSLWPALQLFRAGAAPQAVYMAAGPVIVLVTLFLPRTGAVFDGNYAILAEKDARSVPLHHSIPMWLCLAWMVLPVLSLAALLLGRF